MHVVDAEAGQMLVSGLQWLGGIAVVAAVGFTVRYVLRRIFKARS